MARINIYAKGSDPKTAAPKAAVSKLEYSGTWMESCTLTVSVKSATPIDFVVGDFIVYRDEYFWIDNEASVKKSARKGYNGEGFVYDNLMFCNAIRELQQCDFLDYVKHDTAKYTYSAASSIVFYASTVEDFANRIQANLDRLYTGDRRWQVLVDDNIKDDSKTFDGAGNQIIRDKTVSISNAKVSDVLSEITDTFKTTYTIRGRVLKIGFAPEDVTPADSTFEYYDEANGKRKGLVSLEKTINSQYAIITRLRAYGSERNLPSRYYANRYTTVKIGNNDMPRYGVISTEAGDGNKKMDFAGFDNNGNYKYSTCEWFIKTNVKLPCSFERAEYTPPHGGQRVDKWMYVAKWGGTAKQMFPDPNNVSITLESGDADNHHTIVTIDKVQVFPWRDTSDTSNAQSNVFYLGFYLSERSDEVEEAITDVFATQKCSWAQDPKDYPTLYSADGFCADAFDKAYRVYDSEADTLSLNIFNLMLPGFPTKSLQEYVYGVDGVGGNEGLQEWIADTYGTKDALDGHLSTDKFFPYIDSPNADKYGIRECSIFFSEDNDDYDEVYPSIEAGYNGEDVNYFTFVDATGDSISNSSGYDDQGIFVDEEVGPVGVKVPYAGFDWASVWEEDMALSMKSGMCAGREFTVSKVINIEGVAENGAVLYLERVYDDSVQRYFPYKDFPLTAKSDEEAGDRYVILNIEMPSSYVEAAAEVAFKQAVSYLSEHDKPSYIYTPTLSSVYMQRERDTKILEGNEKGSVWYKIKEGCAITFKDEDVIGSEEETHVINTLSIRDGEDMIPSYEITIQEDEPASKISELEKQVKSLASSSVSVYTAKKNELSYLRRDISDTAKGKITFEQGIGLGAEGQYGLDANGSGTLNVVTAKGKITLEQGLSVGADDNGSIDANGNASLSDVVVERLHDEDSTEAQRTIIGAQGFDLYMGTDGKSHLYVDYLTARTRMFASSVEIRKVSYSGGTTLFSNAGSQICKVSNVCGTDGSVVAYKCFAVADDGTTRTMNWWHIGMMALCQTFNVKAGESENLSNRYYWRMVVGVGQEILSDGKLYDYVMLSNVKTFKGSASTVPSHTKRILADENGNALVWGDVMVEVSLDEGMTSLADTFSNQEGKSADDDGIAIVRRTYYGYEPKEDGTEPDAPLPFDVIVQAGDQIQWKKYGNLIKMSTSTEDNATDNAPSIAMYHNMGAQSLGNPYQWKTRTAVISPEEVRFNASLFKFFTDENEDYDPWEEAKEETKAYTDAQITATKDAITLSIAEKQGVRRNLLQGTACRRQGEGWTHMSGSKTYGGIRCEITDRLNGIGGVNALHVGSRYVSASDYIAAGFRWRGTDSIQGNIKVEKGKTYTLSVWAKSPTPDYMNVVFEAVWQGSATDNTRPAGYAGPTGFRATYTPTEEWSLYKNTVEIPSDAAYEWVEVNIFMKATDSTLREGHLCKPMMEEGDTYNGWTPSEQDYDFIGGNILDNTGTLSEGGNLVETAVLSTDEDGVAVTTATAANGMSAKLLQFGGITLEANEDYLLSFYVKSDTTHAATSKFSLNLVKNVLFAEYNNGESSNTAMKGSTSPNGYISISYIASEWQRVWYHFRLAADTTTQEIDLFVTGSGGEGALSLKKPKLEKGAMPTEWTEKSTDFVDRTALLATGINIETRKVTVTADNFKVQNNLGQETMLVTADGKLNTDIVESRVLKTYLDGGMAGVVIEAGLMKVFNPDGNCNILFGVNDDGYVVLSYYDNTGRKLYDLGPDGLDAKNQSDASLSGTAYVLASAFLGTTEDFYESSTYTVGGKEYILKQVLANYNAALFGGGSGSTPFTNSGSAVTLYKYIAARQQDTVIADSERNLTAALAKQADGKYFTSETICDGTKLLNLASGIHFRKAETVASAPPPVSTETFTYPAYNMKMMSFLNGVLTNIALYSRTERTVSPFV